MTASWPREEYNGNKCWINMVSLSNPVLHISQHAFPLRFIVPPPSGASSLSYFYLIIFSLSSCCLSFLHTLPACVIVTCPLLYFWLQTSLCLSFIPLMPHVHREIKISVVDTLFDHCSGCPLSSLSQHLNCFLHNCKNLTRPYWHHIDFLYLTIFYIQLFFQFHLAFCISCFFISLFQWNTCIFGNVLCL